MTQLEIISVLLNAERNVTGPTVSKAFCIFVPIIETVHTTSTFLSELNNILRLVSIPMLAEVLLW